MAPFLGMRGSGDFTVTGQRPENWREMILYLYPNGSAPLTAMLAKLKSEKTNDPKYHWFELEHPDQLGVITGIYTDTGLSSAYVTGGNTGDTLYLKMSAVDAAKFNVTHQVLLMLSTLPSSMCNFKVTVAPVINGASSYVTVIFLQDDPSDAVVATCDRAIVIGSVNPEGGGAPSSLIYDPTELYNHCQIFRTSLDQTRTAMKTHLRTGDQVKEAKRQALEMHSIEMEKAFWFSYYSLRSGANGKPERTTKGIRNFLSTNVLNYQTGTSATWVQGGETWFEAAMEQIFRYGSNEKIGYCGSGALLGIQQLVKAGAQITITPGQGMYGIKVVTWVTPFGTLHLKMHPLFTLLPPFRNSIGILDTPFLSYRFVDDTKYLPNRQAPDIDGEKREFLTEAGLELHFEKSHGWLDGVGLPGTL